MAPAALGDCGGLGQLWETLAELWEALGKLWDRPSGRYVNPKFHALSARPQLNSVYRSVFV